MVQFPLDPPLSKMLIQSIHLGCVKEMLTIVSMISAPNIFHTTKESAQEENTTVDAAREKFYVPESDHLTLLNVYNQWMANKCSPGWCKQFFIQFKVGYRIVLHKLQYQYNLLNCQILSSDI